MFKILFAPALLSMFFATTTFAQTAAPNQDTTEETSADQKQMKSPEDQFATFVMKGWNAGFEYSSMQADFHLKISSGTSSGTYAANTNGAAGALGASVNYAHLPRNRAGWSAGLAVVSKIENDSNETSSLKSTKGFTQIRPEGNVGYALDNGLWGMIGGHISYMTGGNLVDYMEAAGPGAQISIGYTPLRNFGMDIGYYVSVHLLNKKTIDNIESSGATVDRTESWYAFKQLRARVIYYF